MRCRRERRGGDWSPCASDLAWEQRLSLRERTTNGKERSMGKEKLFKGGEFIITDALPEEIFTPEDFSKDQRLVAQSADEFGQKELLAQRAELENLNTDLLKSMLKKAGDLGFLGADMPEAFGGSELDKVSSMLIGEKLCSGV